MPLIDDLRAVLSSMKRDDPLNRFVPTEKQVPVLDAVLGRKSQLVLFVCANRAGKSIAGAYIGSTLARRGFRQPKVTDVGDGMVITDRATQGWVIGLDYPLLRDSIQPKYFDNGFMGPSDPEPFIPVREIQRWSSGDQILRLKNGSIIGFKSQESGREKFQAVARDWVHGDEEMRKDIFEECMVRVGNNPLHMFITATLLPPAGHVGGVTWIYSDMLAPYMEGTRKDILAYGSAIWDNPHIPREEIDRLVALYPPGTPQYRIRLAGEWLPGVSGTRAYHAFDRRKHVYSQASQFDENRPLIWFMDFNVEPLCCGVGQHHQMFRVFHEIILEQGNVHEMVEAFREIYPSHRAGVWIYGDASGHARTSQTNRNNYTLILEGMMGYPAPVRLKVPASNPPVADRLNAVNMALSGFDGQIGVAIDPRCKELVTDLEQVVLAQNASIKKSSDKRDPYYRRTHISDALGYWVHSVKPVVLQRPRGLAPTIKRATY